MIKFVCYLEIHCILHDTTISSSLFMTSHIDGTRIMFVVWEEALRIFTEINCEYFTKRTVGRKMRFNGSHVNLYGLSRE